MRKINKVLNQVRSYPCSLNVFIFWLVDSERPSHILHLLSKSFESQPFMDAYKFDKLFYFAKRNNHPLLLLLSFLHCFLPILPHHNLCYHYKDCHLLLLLLLQLFFSLFILLSSSFCLSLKFSAINLHFFLYFFLYWKKCLLQLVGLDL